MRYTLLQNLKMEVRLFFYTTDSKEIVKIAAAPVDDRSSMYL